MLFSCLASGFSASTRHLKLALVLWAGTLVIAMPATFAFAAWWWSALAYSVPGRSGDLATFIDMLEYNDTNALSLVMASLGGTMLVALVANAFLSVGVIEVLVGAGRASANGTAPDGRRLLHRVFRGGGRLFLRSLGVLLVGLLVAAVAVGVGAAGAGAAVRPLDDAMSVPAAWTHLLLPVVLVGLLVVFFCGIVIDLARVELVRRDTRNPVTAYWRGLTLAGRKWRTTLWIWLLAGVLAVALFAVQQLVAPARAKAVPAFVGIQLLIIALAWLRVSVLGAEVELSSRMRPDAVPAVEAPRFDEPELNLREPEPVPGGETAVADDAPPLVTSADRKDV
jgi:hypothetical protein